MRTIEKIEAVNFGAIKHSSFELAAYTPLVGINNSGKSTLLRAINWMLSRSSLAVEQFGDRASPVSVAVLLTGITDAVLSQLTVPNRNRVEPFVEDGRLWYRQKQTSPGISVTQIQPSLCRPSEYRERDEDCWTNPVGIEAALRSILPPVLFVEAMDDAPDSVAKFKQGNTLGKIVAELSETLNERHGEDIRAAMENLENLFSAEGRTRSPVLTEIDRGATTALSDIFPGLELKLHLSTPSLKELFQTATFKVQEAGRDSPRPFTSLGHGAQRSIQVALIKYLSELGNAEDARQKVLLIDEPEIYLHPHAIDVLCGALGKLSRGQYQVIFSTHSPMMIARDDAPDTLIINRDPVHGTSARPRIRDAVVTAVDGAEHQSDMLFQISQSRDLLFCKRIIFAEGKTERAVIPPLFELERGLSLGACGAALMSMNGVSNYAAVRKIVDALGIESRYLFDFDFLFRGAISARLIEEDNADITALKAMLSYLDQQNADIALDASGLPTCPDKRTHKTATQIYELLVDEPDANDHIANLQTILRANGIWIWTRGAIERHVGTTKKTVHEWNRVIAEATAHGTRALPHGAEVVEFLSWITD